MIKYLKRSDIDSVKWDLCIEHSVNKYVYAYSWYLDIVADDWDALVEDDYSSVFPLPFRKKFGFKYLYQPAFAQQLGVFTTQQCSEKRLLEFINAIPKEFKLIEINLNKYFYPSAQSVDFVSRVNIELDLYSDYVTLEKSFSSNLKRNLKKAKTNKLQVNEHSHPESLIKLFKENRGKNLKTYSDLDYSKLTKLLYSMINKGIAKILNVYSEENNLLASAVFVKIHKRIIFLFSGLSEEGKNKNAMPLLINFMIEQNASSDFTFDFEGSNDLNLARFYLSFGSYEFHYYQLNINRMNLLGKMVFNFYKYINSK